MNFNKEGCDSMANTIKEIVDAYNNSESRFMEYQQRRLKELQERIKAKERGEVVDVSDIIKRWQAAGILDSNGNIAEIYRLED